MNDKVFLCHKCGGLLTSGKNIPKELHGCICISGWVRDWQEPVTLEKAMQTQYDMAINNAEWTYKRNAPGDQERTKDYLKRADELLEALTAPSVAA